MARATEVQYDWRNMTPEQTRAALTRLTAETIREHGRAKNLTDPAERIQTEFGYPYKPSLSIDFTTHQFMGMTHYHGVETEKWGETIHF